MSILDYMVPNFFDTFLMGEKSPDKTICGVCGKDSGFKVAKAPVYGGFQYYYYHPECIDRVLNNAEDYPMRKVDFALEVSRIIKEDLQ